MPKQEEDIFMKPVKATLGIGDKLATSTMKGVDNLAKGFAKGFSKGFKK